MAEQLITSTKAIKERLPISDNVSDKYTSFAIYEAQEFDLKGILGETLLEKIKADIVANNLTGIYATIRERSQFYLALRTAVHLTESTAFKIANAGVIQSNDEHSTNASKNDFQAVRKMYIDKSDVAKLDLQNFLNANNEQIPELHVHDCDKVNAETRSAATCGIFLGGVRGKVL